MVSGNQVYKNVKLHKDADEQHTKKEANCFFGKNNLKFGARHEFQKT